MRKPLAILCADLHLSLKAPVSRSAEPDWLEAQARPLKQLRELQMQFKCPVVIAGDIFDRWNSPSELVNFALGHLPDCVYAIPGQHDLAYHSYGDIKKTSFWTLVRAGKITLIDRVGYQEVMGPTPLRLYGFAWGAELNPCKDNHDLCVSVAVVHKYVWTRNNCYPGAPEDGHVLQVRLQLQGYDLIITGDNHKPFQAGFKKEEESVLSPLFNCGGFQKRKMDEREHEPSVGLLYPDGDVERHYLDCSEDKWIEQDKAVEVLSGIGMQSFVEELSALGDVAIDFADAVRRLMDREKVPDGVRTIIGRVLERASGK